MSSLPDPHEAARPDDPLLGVRPSTLREPSGLRRHLGALIARHSEAQEADRRREARHWSDAVDTAAALSPGLTPTLARRLRGRWPGVDAALLANPHLQGALVERILREAAAAYLRLRPPVPANTEALAAPDWHFALDTLASYDLHRARLPSPVLDRAFADVTDGGRLALGPQSGAEGWADRLAVWMDLTSQLTRLGQRRLLALFEAVSEDPDGLSALAEHPSLDPPLARTLIVRDLLPDTTLRVLARRDGLLAHGPLRSALRACELPAVHRRLLRTAPCPAAAAALFRELATLAPCLAGDVYRHELSSAVRAELSRRDLAPILAHASGPVRATVIRSLGQAPVA